MREFTQVAPAVHSRRREDPRASIAPGRVGSARPPLRGAAQDGEADPQEGGRVGRLEAPRAEDLEGALGVDAEGAGLDEGLHTGKDSRGPTGLPGLARNPETSLIDFGLKPAYVNGMTDFLLALVVVGEFGAESPASNDLDRLRARRAKT